jgi:hypothetical protein
VVLLGVLAVGSCSEEVDEPAFGGNGGGNGTGGEGTQSGTDGTTSASSSGTTTGGSSGTSSGTTSSPCGNGVIDPGESCDGTDLDGATCESLGEGTGTLSCDPVTCTFDTSMCSGNGSSTSGG